MFRFIDILILLLVLLILLKVVENTPLVNVLGVFRTKQSYLPSLSKNLGVGRVVLCN